MSRWAKLPAPDPAGSEFSYKLDEASLNFAKQS